MNRKKFLEALRAQEPGYKGKADLAEVKAWMAENGLDVDNVEGADGETMSVDEVWAKAASLSVRSDTVEPPGDDKKAKRGAGFGVIAKAGGTAHRDYARKRYENRIAMGLTVYKDVDQAEAFGAHVRAAAAKVCRIENYAMADEDAAIIAKTATTNNNASAGALVPEEYVNELIDLHENYGVATRLATVWAMGSDTSTFPRSTGTQAMVPIGEGAAITPLDDTFDNVKLVTQTYGRLAVFSNQLLQDSAVNVADVFARKIAEASAKAIDAAYINGDGTSTYAGQVGLTAALPTGAYIAQGTSNTWSAQVMADFHKIVGSVENVNTGRLAWLCSRSYFAQVMQRLLLAQGGSSAVEAVTGTMTRSGNADAMFLGYPVFFSDLMPKQSATAHRSCYFGDFFGASMVGIRKGVEIASSSDRYFDANSFALRAIMRFNSNIHGDGKASTYGPVVALKTG